MSAALIGLWLVAAAQQPGELEQVQAQALHQKGTGHYNLKEYRKALEAFLAAYELAPASGLLFNIAQAHRMLGKGHCVQARTYYSRYLAAAPRSSNRAAAEEQYKSLDECARAEEREAELRPQPPSPNVQPEPVKTSEPEPVKMSEPVKAPEALIPGPASVPASPQNVAAPNRLPPVVMALGLAIGAIGGGILIAADFRFRDLRDNMCRVETCAPSVYRLWPEVEQAAWAAVIVGAVAAVVGLVWWAVS